MQDKIFRIRKDTGLNEAVKKEFEVDRFLWVFSQNWRKAKKENGLDSYWDGVNKMMENYDRENPTGRRMVSKVAAKVTSAIADTRKDSATTPTANVSLAIAEVPSANDGNYLATKGTGNVSSAIAKDATANDKLSTPKSISPIAIADVASATAKVASANDNKTSATKHQAIDHHSLNPPPLTSKSISPSDGQG